MNEEIPVEAWEKLVPEGEYEFLVETVRIKAGRTRGTPYFAFEGYILRPLEYEKRKIFVNFAAWSSPVLAFQCWNLGLVIFHELAEMALHYYVGRRYKITAKVVKYGDLWYNDFRLVEWLNKGEHT